MKALQLTILILILTVFTFGQSNSWNGIRPLYSTRNDIEKLLGVPYDTHTYKTKNEVVIVNYSVDRCQGDLPGWNVPAGTILSFSVRPSSLQSIDKLRLDQKKFIETNGHGGLTFYTNSDTGIQYEVTPNETINLIRYTPAKKDAKLRCKGFPPYDPVTETYSPIERYNDQSLEFGIELIDNIADGLQKSPNNKVYIFVYAEKRKSNKQYNLYLQKLKTHLSRKGFLSENIFLKSGGYRDAFAIEVFVLPNTFPAPVPTPTLSGKLK